MKKISINNIKYLILLIVGIFSIVLYFWGRFIRERLSRNIPFELTLWSLSLLIIIIICFIIAIKHLIKPKISSLYQIIYPTLLKMYQPVYIINDIIKDNKYVNQIIPLIA